MGNHRSQQAAAALRSSGGENTLSWLAEIRVNYLHDRIERTTFVIQTYSDPRCAEREGNTSFFRPTDSIAAVVNAPGRGSHSHQVTNRAPAKRV